MDYLDYKTGFGRVLINFLHPPVLWSLSRSNKKQGSRHTYHKKQEEKKYKNKHEEKKSSYSQTRITSDLLWPGKSIEDTIMGKTFLSKNEVSRCILQSKGRKNCIN